MSQKPNQKFINRELSWLEFNQRVLNEALDETNPLLERLKFLAISSSNLDEFFMVRVGGLHLELASGNLQKDITGLTAEEQLVKIRNRVEKMVEQQMGLFHNLRDLMQREAQIKISDPEDLNSSQLEEVERFFEQEIFASLSPARPM